MSDCVFCKIAAGEIPSYCVRENELFKAILDIAPSSLGHTLVIPKRHADDLFALDEESAAGLMPFAKEVAHSLSAVLGCDGMNLLQNNGEAAGQTVRHFHMHLIPRYVNDNIKVGWELQKPKEEEFVSILDKLKNRE